MSGAARLEVETVAGGEGVVWFCRGETRAEVDRLGAVVEVCWPGTPTFTEWDEVTLYGRAGAFFVARRSRVDIHVVGDSSTCAGWRRSTDGVCWEPCRAPEDPGPALCTVSSPS